MRKVVYGTLTLASIDRAIVGGESGPGARPMKEIWVREIHAACLQYRTAFFLKQWGGKNKKRHGRTLDGRAWDECPEVRATI
jgi:protein gp37